MEAITFRRTTGIIEAQIDNGAWAWRYIPDTENEPEQPQLSPFEQAFVDAGWGTQRAFKQSEIVMRGTVEQFCSMLTEDEGMAVLGYLAHVLEQTYTHVGYLIQAQADALVAKDWRAIRKIAQELHETLGAVEVADVTGRLMVEGSCEGAVN